MHAGSADACSDLSSLDPDILKDLKYQLRINCHGIIKRYNSYVDCIRTSINKQGKTAEDLRTFLMGLPAFSHGEKQDVLFSDSKLGEAVDVDDVFILLIKEYSSFLNYGIFESLQEEFVINRGQEGLRYPEHLKAYVDKHKIAEYTEVKLVLGNISDTSEEIIVRFDIELTCRLARLRSLENEVTKVLGINPAGLRFKDIKLGCVIVKFLILTSISHVIFTRDKQHVFTSEQIKKFRALPIQWLQYKDYRWDFNGVDEDTQFSTTGNYIMTV